jgi:hypothetical protein
VNVRAFAAATLTFVAAGLLAIEFISWSQSAPFGPTMDPISRCELRIATLGATGQLSGLRVGDTLLMPQMTLPSRVAIFYRDLPIQTGRAGETIQLVVQRGERQLNIPYLLRHTDSLSSFIAQIVFKVVVLAVGVLVLWRGRDRASLVLGIWCLGVSVALPGTWWGALPVHGRLAAGVIAAGLWSYSPFVLYLIIESIATNVDRRLVLTARTALVLSMTPEVFATTVNQATLAVSGCSLVYLQPSIVNALFTGTQLIIIAFFTISYLGSTGLVKQRIRWIFWAFLVSRFGVLVNEFNRLVHHPVQLSGIEWFTVMLFPLGCAYAILRHRIIDVNFVLNRTLVYTLLTSFAVGVFVLLEDILTKIAAGRGLSMAVELGVALGLGLSFNALHKRTETVLERTLFRRKHEAAVRLQRLSEEAAYTENADALLQRATTEIPHAMGAGNAAIFERRDGAYRLACASGNTEPPNTIPIDDLAFIRLRKDLSQIDLSDVSSALGSDGVAFAFAVRGQLFGAFVCGRRLDGETYAPDEIAMVRKVVHEVGAELHAIRDRERTDLLNAIVTGTIDLDAARRRLIALG